ncbi:ECF transporter S component [Anaerotignum lactatifermentans]|uniref:ECF transporter S component n=1 Tax=Anaerotignum lactatifermentans TaxID=160404 RepID=A0ABS2GC41_9FIRM|nr:ECF transporter S component [Anaerotignum lactatifermentans]MBM6830203.1 ECF transporter S component [Anaerotignum lactatifermentans]MBM6878752.1 ECF transporter S component [Anaerotignum lactatifermentans]MBM6951816.1 ECF transporter S component [Anaerotignum lactatifermentans]
MKTKDICLQGLMIALVTVSTMVFQIPVSATQGYIHLGDSMILLISIFFGWRYGMVAGGVGSALADLLSGYAHWVPFTLVIKGLMGLIIGKAADYAGKEGHFFRLRNLLGSVLGLVWMVLGYFLGGAVLKSSFLVAATSIPENAIQAAAGMVIFLVVGYAFSKAHITKYISVK